MRPDTTLV